MHLACDVCVVQLPALQIDLYSTLSINAEANDLHRRDRGAPPYDVTLDIRAAHNTELQRDAGSKKKRKPTPHAGCCIALRCHQTDTIVPLTEWGRLRGQQLDTGEDCPTFKSTPFTLLRESLTTFVAVQINVESVFENTRIIINFQPAMRAEGRNRMRPKG